jgi:hypothetical protein
MEYLKLNVILVPSDVCYSFLEKREGYEACLKERSNLLTL